MISLVDTDPRPYSDVRDGCPDSRLVSFEGRVGSMDPLSSHPSTDRGTLTLSPVDGSTGHHAATPYGGSSTLPRTGKDKVGVGTERTVYVRWIQDVPEVEV